VLYLPAILLPILTIEKLGQRHAAGVLSGCLELIKHGSYFVGGVILVFSIMLPLVKFALLLFLCTGQLLREEHQAWTYRVIETLGRWSMLDVLLVAMLVALVKLGDLVQFHIGPGAWFFTLCVAMSIIASTSFDPHAIWDTERSRGRNSNRKKNPESNPSGDPAAG
jgi:paraquat-inducible protein A